MNGFQHTVSEHGDHVLLALAGDLDFAAYPGLAALVTEVIESGRSVVVECSAVAFLDSMGLRALVEGVRGAAAAGLGFTLADPSPPVSRVLELTGTSGLFTIRGPVPEEPGA